MPDHKSMSEVLRGERSRILAERDDLLKKIDNAIVCVEEVEGISTGTTAAADDLNGFYNYSRTSAVGNGKALRTIAHPGTRQPNRFWPSIFDSAVAKGIDMEDGRALWRFVTTAAGVPDDPKSKTRFWTAHYNYRQQHQRPRKQGKK